MADQDKAAPVAPAPADPAPTGRTPVPTPTPADPSPGFAFKPTLTGALTTLRPVTADDLPALLPMFRDEETARLTGSHGTLGDAALRTWYATRAGQDDRLDLAVVERATGEVVGEAVLNEWDPGNESCSFRICFVPGAPGRGLGTEATRLIVGYGFETLGLHRISLEVYAFNPRARRAYEKAGFVPEGVLRGALLWKGERVDAHVMSVLAPEWFRHRGHPERGTAPAPERGTAPAPEGSTAPAPSQAGHRQETAP